MATSPATVGCMHPTPASTVKPRTHHSARSRLGRSRKRGCDALQKRRDAVAVGVVVEPDAHHLCNEAGRQGGASGSCQTSHAPQQRHPTCAGKIGCTQWHLSSTDHCETVPWPECSVTAARAACWMQPDPHLVCTVAVQHVRLLHLALEAAVHVLHKVVGGHCSVNIFVHSQHTACSHSQHTACSLTGAEGSKGCLRSVQVRATSCSMPHAATCSHPAGQPHHTPALFLFRMMNWNRGCERRFTRNRLPSTSLRLWCRKGASATRRRSALEPAHSGAGIHTRSCSSVADVRQST